MTMSRPARILLRVLFILGLAFIYVPLGVVVINSFNADQTFSWPPTEWTRSSAPWTSRCGSGTPRPGRPADGCGTWRG